jgi:carbamoylphosphate synthase large subunit
LVNSKCATEKQQKEYLHELLGNKKLVTTLLYSGSLHGWMTIDFHSRCDNKEPTITLFKIENGDCIGGYTKAKLSSNDDFQADSEAMLFNLSCCRHFPT